MQRLNWFWVWCFAVLQNSTAFCDDPVTVLGGIRDSIRNSVQQQYSPAEASFLESMYDGPENPVLSWLVRISPETINKDATLVICSINFVGTGSGASSNWQTLSHAEANKELGQSIFLITRNHASSTERLAIVSAVVKQGVAGKVERNLVAVTKCYKLEGENWSLIPEGLGEKSKRNVGARNEVTSPTQ